MAPLLSFENGLLHHLTTFMWVWNTDVMHTFLIWFAYM